MIWRKWVAAMAIGVSVFGVAACNNSEDLDDAEQRVDELDEDVRENTP